MPITKRKRSHSRSPSPRRRTKRVKIMEGSHKTTSPPRRGKQKIGRTASQTYEFSKAKVKKMCRQKTTYAELEEYWMTLKKRFEALFAKNAYYHEDAKSKNDNGLLKQVIKARHQLRLELSYVERVVATCAMQYNLENPVLKFPL